jgi:hypothetical protein
MCSSFMPEVDLGQTAGLLLNASKAIPNGNPLFWNVLAFPLRTAESLTHHPPPKVRMATKCLIRAEDILLSAKSARAGRIRVSDLQ